MTELEIIEAVLTNPDLVCMNVRHDENDRRKYATTLITKGNSEWVKGEGRTVAEAIMSLAARLRDKGIVLETRPVALTTQPAMPGLTRNRMPGV